MTQSAAASQGGLISGGTGSGVDDNIASVPMGSTFAIVRAIGNPSIKAEEFRDLEAGYRAQANKRLALEVAAFAGLYRNLESSHAQVPYFATHQGVHYLVLHELVVNGPGARTYGGDFFAHWNLIDRRRISPGYTYFHIHIDGIRRHLLHRRAYRRIANFRFARFSTFRTVSNARTRTDTSASGWLEIFPGMRR